MKSVDELDAELVAMLDAFPSQDERYAYMIKLGNALPPMADEMKRDRWLVSGCQTKIWIWAHKIGEEIHYEADSNSVLNKGILSLLLPVINKRKPEEIANAKFEFISHANPADKWSIFRSSGMRSLIATVKSHAEPK